MSDMELIKVLDSPLLRVLAPELLPFLTKVQKLRDETAQASCTACAKRRVMVELLTIQQNMKNIVDAKPELAAVIPQLQASLPKAAP